MNRRIVFILTCCLISLFNSCSITDGYRNIPIRGYIQKDSDTLILAITLRNLDSLCIIKNKIDKFLLNSDEVVRDTIVNSTEFNSKIQQVFSCFGSKCIFEPLDTIYIAIFKNNELSSRYKYRYCNLIMNESKTIIVPDTLIYK